MPVTQDNLTSAAAIGGRIAYGEIAPLVADRRLRIVHLRADAPRETWEALNDHLFATRGDVILGIDSFFPAGADLTLLRHVPNVRRLCVTSAGTEEITSVESIAALPKLESLQIGSPSLRSFDVLDALPTGQLRELRLADTRPHMPSLGPVARFTGLRSLHIDGHSVDLEAIQSLGSLRQLGLTSIRLADFRLLRRLPELVSLRFSLGGVRDVGALAELHRLRHLDVFQSSGFVSLAFLAGMRGLEMLELGNLPNVRDLPNLSSLAELRRVSLRNLKRLDDLEGLAMAPGLDAYMQQAVAPSWTPEHFRPLLEHPTLRQFTAVFGSRKKDGAIREFAARMGKVPVSASVENPFAFVL